jgi:hypothetical protein
VGVQDVQVLGRQVHRVQDRRREPLEQLGERLVRDLGERPAAVEPVAQEEEQALAVGRARDLGLEMRRQELGKPVLGVDRAVLCECGPGADERVAVLELDREPRRRPAQVHDVRRARVAMHRGREARALPRASDRAPPLGDGIVRRLRPRRPPGHPPAVRVPGREVGERGEVGVADRLGDRERPA